MPLTIKSKDNCRWDLVSLGEVMLRLDPGEGRVHTTRSFEVWEGGGEYNVARGLRRCFGLDAAIVTALADNPVGHLVQDLIYQGGVDQSHLKWVKYDGVGRSVRNGLNFTERGFGVRAALGCSDRGHTAVSQLNPATSTGKRFSDKKKYGGFILAASSAPCPKPLRRSRAKRLNPPSDTARSFLTISTTATHYGWALADQPVHAKSTANWRR